MKASGNYLAGNSSHDKRNKGDFYQTPYHCTRLLLEHHHVNLRDNNILEPAAGKGAIVKVLKEYNYDCESYDIETNFFTESRKFTTVITNPPFRLANDFILKAKQVANYDIYMLLPLNYLQGAKRYKLIFQDEKFPLHEIFCFTRYLMMTEETREDGTCGFGMMAFAWFHWVYAPGINDYGHGPLIKWLDNDKYIKRNNK